MRPSLEVNVLGFRVSGFEAVCPGFSKVNGDGETRLVDFFGN